MLYHFKSQFSESKFTFYYQAKVSKDLIEYQNIFIFLDGKILVKLDFKTAISIYFSRDSFQYDSKLVCIIPSKGPHSIFLYNDYVVST